MKGIEVAFEGRLGRDAQLRTSSAGREWLSLSVIVGEEGDEQWVSVASWSHTIAELGPVLVKGAQVYIEGKVKLRTWQGPEGMQSGLSVSASLVQPLALIGNRKPKRPRAEKTRATSAAKRTDPNSPIPFNDALPF
jgi:single-stranded DNA-binding protein